jgi:nucleotide-binding universal stress UspA family protein
MTIQRILVAHDFSDTAQSALDLALSLAEKLDAAVLVMHAYEIPTYGLPEGPVMTVEMVKDIETAARTALDGVVARAQRPGISVKAVLRHGPAWSEVEAVARETKADLVVVGTHGRRGLARALLGSVAEKVVRTAPCAVLTVRGKAEPR